MLAFLLRLFGIRYGVITIVADGSSHIRVDTGFTPSRVWINPGPYPGKSDGFDCQIVSNGFVLHFNINCEFRSVSWVARTK